MGLSSRTVRRQTFCTKIWICCIIMLCGFEFPHSGIFKMAVSNTEDRIGSISHRSEGKRLFGIPLAAANAADEPNTCSSTSDAGNDQGSCSVNPETIERTSATTEPMLKFGIITDIHWTTIPGEDEIEPGVKRYYRASFLQTEEAFNGFKEADVDFAVNLGDTVDGKLAKVPLKGKALIRIVDVFKSLNKPVLHALGENCVTAFPRARILGWLGIQPWQRSEKNNNLNATAHYSYSTPLNQHKNTSSGTENANGNSAARNFKFIMLDGTDISRSWPSGHENRIEADAILKKKNPNKNKASVESMKGLEKRFISENGGISKAQLEWFEEELKSSQQAGDMVMVGCHMCMHPGTCPEKYLLYNYDEVLAIMKRYSGTIVAALSGHAHTSKSLSLRNHGINFAVFPAVADCPQGSNAWGIAYVYGDRIEIKGTDRFPSFTWPLTSGKAKFFDKILHIFK